MGSELARLAKQQTYELIATHSELRQLRQGQEASQAVAREVSREQRHGLTTLELTLDRKLGEVLGVLMPMAATLQELRRLATTQVQNNANEHFAMAQDLRQKGLLSDALAQVEMAISGDGHWSGCPFVWQYHAVRGQLLLNMPPSDAHKEPMREAEVSFLEAARLASTETRAQATALVGAATAALRRNVPHAALAHVQKAMELQPGMVEAVYCAGRVELALENCDAAFSSLRNAILTEPAYALVLVEDNTSPLLPGQPEQVEQFLARLLDELVLDRKQEMESLVRAFEAYAPWAHAPAMLAAIESETEQAKRLIAERTICSATKAKRVIADVSSRVHEVSSKNGRRVCLEQLGNAAADVSKTIDDIKKRDLMVEERVPPHLFKKYVALQEAVSAISDASRYTGRKALEAAIEELGRVHVAIKDLPILARVSANTYRISLGRILSTATWQVVSFMFEFFPFTFPLGLTWCVSAVFCVLFPFMLLFSPASFNSKDNPVGLFFAFGIGLIFLVPAVGKALAKELEQEIDADLSWSQKAVGWSLSKEGHGSVRRRLLDDARDRYPALWH